MLKIKAGKDENDLRRCRQTKICSRIYIFGDFPAKEDNTPHALFTMMSSFHYRAIMGALLPSSWDCDENSRVQLQQVDAGCVAAVPYGNNGPHKGLKLPVSIKKHLCECYESTQ